MLAAAVALVVFLEQRGFMQTDLFKINLNYVNWNIVKLLVKLNIIM